jgi:hypothetical protein
MKSPQRQFRFLSGQHLFECQRCGFVFHSQEKLLEWTGTIVCRSCYEEKHPLEGPIKFPKEKKPPKHLSPSVVSYPVCTVDGSSATADVAIAGCAIADRRWTGTL